MEYRVLHDCYGFQGRFWHRDEIVILDPKSKPPVEHFVPLDEVVVAKSEDKVEAAVPEIQEPVQTVTEPEPDHRPSAAPKSKPKKRLK